MGIFEIYARADWEDAQGELPVNFEAGPSELPWDFIFQETGFSPDQQIEAGELTQKIGNHEIGSPTFVNLTTGQLAVMQPPREMNGALVFARTDEQFEVIKDALGAALGAGSCVVTMDKDDLHLALHELVLKVADATLQKVVADQAEQGSMAWGESFAVWATRTRELVHQFLEELGVKVDADHPPPSTLRNMRN